MSSSNPTVSSSSHAVPGGTEVDVTITVPTPASQVHPDTPVVPASDPSAAPAPAGTVADSSGPDTLVVSPGSTSPAEPPSSPATPTGVTPGEGHVPASPGDPSGADVGPIAAPTNDNIGGGDQPATTTAGDVSAGKATDTAGDATNAGTPVARVDDPDKTLVPAGDLPPGSEVHDPAGPIPGTGPVTAAELAANIRTEDGRSVTSEEAQAVMDELGAAGYVITRK